MSEPIETNSPNSVPHTPAYVAFDSNTDRLMHFIQFMDRGLEGIYQEEKLSKIKNLSLEIDSISQELDLAVANNEAEKLKSWAARISEIGQVVSDDAELRGSHISGFGVGLEWMLVLWVTIAEIYLIDVLAYAASVIPGMMAKSEISASYLDTVSASSLEELRQGLRYRWARNFINDGGPKYWINKLERMGARGYNTDLAREMETFWGIRHLIVHTGGVVTPDFVHRHPEFNAVVGERLQVELKQVANCGEYIYDFVDVTDAFFAHRCNSNSLQT